MTKDASNLFLNWAENHSKTEQKVLAIAIEDSKNRGEEINRQIAEEIIKVVEDIIEEAGKENIKRSNY
jgi:hypothetical protein